MKIVTTAHNDVDVITEADGTESITIQTAHGRVEVTIGPRSPIDNMVVQVFRSVCETTVATVETGAADHYLNPNCCGAHSTVVIK